VRSERLVRSGSEGETEALGEAIGALLGSGDLIELRGELGAGKTCWVRGLARGLGVVEPIRSPTFTICHVHRGRILLFHLDAYRIEDPGELIVQGFDEMPARGAVAIEWGERVPGLLPADRLVIAIEYAPGGRVFRFRALGPRSERLLAAVGGVRPDARDTSSGEDGRDPAGEAGSTRPGRRRHGAQTEETS
jgi:tRNA threonylcarbamoyladenosine biosynthesis protein TsaE